MFGEKFKNHLSENNEEEKEKIEREKRRHLFNKKVGAEMSDNDMKNFLENLEFLVVEIKKDDKLSDNNLESVDFENFDGEIKSYDYDEAKDFLYEGIFSKNAKIEENLENKEESSKDKSKDTHREESWLWRSSSNMAGENIFLNGMNHEIPLASIRDGKWIIAIFDKATPGLKILKDNLEIYFVNRKKRGAGIPVMENSFLGKKKKGLSDIGKEEKIFSSAEFDEEFGNPSAKEDKNEKNDNSLF
ncbi:MAG: hypothetical protein PHI66_05030 [Candidatus Pacebacteria bacterium]|nr:hypothetical protein [Candidatus Paceibacterota bacterium]